MAETSYPFSGRGLLESQWRALWTSILPDGVIRGEGDGALVYANSTGQAVYRKSGGAFVQGSRWSADAETRYTVPPNTSGQPRTDRLVLRYNPTTHDTTTQLIVGTPDAAAPLPALTKSPTGVWEFPLAHWRATPGFATLNPGDVIDDRVFYGVPILVGFPAAVRAGSPTGSAWNLGAQSATYRVVDGKVEGWARVVNGDNGPAFSAVASHFVALPTPPPPGFVGEVGSFAYVTDNLTPVAVGSIYFDPAQTGAAGRLVPATGDGLFTTSYLRSLACTFSYPAA